MLSLSLSVEEMCPWNVMTISQVSAGHAHSAVVTTDGELYCWGNNRGGCCGQPLAARSVVQYVSLVFFMVVVLFLLLLRFNQRLSYIHELAW